ncbi:MAG: DUF2141 domain-containing protein [Bacteroidota bacterium]
MIFTFIGLLILGLANDLNPSIVTLRLEVNALQEASGCIRIAIYNAADQFDQKDAELTGRVMKVKNLDEIDLYFEDIPFGEYGIAVYHDVNENDRLDKNALGIPIEPYAFSNNPKVKWKAPKYRDIKFHFSKDQQEVNLVLKKWSKH